jgi:hypothetical protein
LKTKYEGAETGDTIQEKARIFVQNLIQVKVFKFSLLQKSNYLAFLFQQAKNQSTGSFAHSFAQTFVKTYHVRGTKLWRIF